ncbi:hypothetical protein Anas_12481 [Armadillidium nasatum]|uniref:Uncharacterized protein n=1 Tax=Armadillidium nasatum TaxID=96803 RepID=A0A5N5T479_9CRUS|nr:hypothetical protein Anas_12481 [Armadillidium nasatum]
MDFKHETEIKSEFLEYIDDDGNSSQCFNQVLRCEELQVRSYPANINIKSEIEVKDEPFDIVETKDQSLGIEEEDSMIDELAEPCSEFDKNQLNDKWLESVDKEKDLDMLFSSNLKVSGQCV